MAKISREKEKAILETRRPQDFVKMLLPVAGVMIAFAEWYSTPIVYPANYVNDNDPIYFPMFLAVYVAVYLIFYFISVFSGKLRLRLQKWAWLLFAVPVVLCLWDLATLKSGFFVLPFTPGPDKILSILPNSWETILTNIGFSLELFATGVLIGLVTGFASGILIGWSYFFDYWLSPLMKIIGPVPSAAWLPIVVALMPSAHAASLFLIALAVWFPLTLMLSSALKSTDIKKVEAARVLGASERYILFHVALPLALPEIFNGLFMGLSSSFTALVVAEQLGVKGGLGWYINWSAAWAEYAKVFCVVGIFIIIFYLLTTLLFKIRDHVMKWKEGTVKW